MRIAWLTFFIILSFSSFSQEYPKREKGLWGMGGQALGPVNIGLYSDVYLSPKVESNFGLSFNLSFHLGFNYHFLGDPKALSPYLGAQFVSIRQSSGTISLEGADRSWGAYVPIGLQYMMPSGLTIGVDAGPSFLTERYDQLNTNQIIGSVRVVYHFLNY